MIIYMTQSNSDMTEGRGPMRNEIAFLNREDAAKYIDNQPGVMGRRMQWSKEKFGDWEIVEINVQEGPFDAQQALKEKAMKKLKSSLTVEEIKALGL
jgi:hypothetical protein